MENKSFFHLYENALSKEFCNNVIKRFESDKRKESGKIGNGAPEGTINNNIKATTELPLYPDLNGWEDVLYNVHQNTQKHLSLYLKQWQQALNIQIYPEIFKVAKYDIGGQFNWHSDNIGNSVTRVLTAIWYLNDVEEGGETVYPWQGVSVKPRTGTLLICPVGWTFFHRSAPVRSNPKYIIITQLHQKI